MVGYTGSWLMVQAQATWNYCRLGYFLHEKNTAMRDLQWGSLSLKWGGSPDDNVRT